MPSPALSKSLFKLGLACPIKLKHALARPAAARHRFIVIVYKEI